MKKLLLFILACSISLAGFSQDNDYKWLVGADTGATYASADGANGGNITMNALYSVTDDLMLGGAISFNFGDLEVSLSLSEDVTTLVISLLQHLMT